MEFSGKRQSLFCSIPALSCKPPVHLYRWNILKCDLLQLGGFLALVALPIYSTTATVVLSPPERPPTGHLAAQIMQRYQLRALFCPPTIFEQLVQEPEGLARAKQLDFLLYAGGPLSNTTGSLLSEVTDVCQFYGSTETTSVTALVPLREDWAYLEFHPSSGADMQPFEDDAYEMVLHKDPKLQGVRAVSCNFPDVEHWHTKDLFRPHPTKPSLWQFYGRTDDIIVLSNGEKFNPVPSEVIVAGHHLLSGALIVGQGRFQAALLVEAGEIAIPTETLIKDIWPIVERANAQAPGHARIIRSMIKVAEPGKRFERAAKGTIIRKMTAAKFAQEIEDLYSKKDLIGPIPVLTATGDIEAIRSYVRASITLSSAMTNLKDDDDLYVHGLDSLKSAEIVSILKSGFGDLDTSWLSMQTLYAHPTVRKLSEVTFKRLNPHETAADGETGLEPSRVAQMASLVKEFTQDLPQNSPRKDTSPNRSKINVALTGSTGSLGTHLLRTLLDDPTISKIYCLNRSPNAQEKQSKSFTALYLSPNLNTPRVEFIQANYGETQLGLPNTLYEELTSTVDIIIHNAWKVDFNHTLSSFTPVHIHGIRNLIDWNLSSTRNPPIIFISSISSVGNWKATDGPVPEVIIPNHDVAQQMGYAESKHVSECILSIASETSGVPISILRVGQIAGPVTATGSWNRDEWFPSMIKTSQSLGYLPNHIPDIDWIPVDILASTILDILHFTTATEEKSQVYNIVNPQSTPWTSVINTVLSRLSPQHIQVVDLSKWIQMLEQVNQADIQDLTAKPAAKILDFYRACEKARKEGSVQYSTSHGISASKTMRNLTPVNAAWMGKWLHQLGY